ncbi:MAG: hypothetical protein EXR73_09475 [Myxococcales bacterium]|nr:hypothetical protein [Myxococcales bacterium]
MREFLDVRRRAKAPVENLEQFERELHTLFAAAEAEAVGDELARFDVNLPGVEIDGAPHRRVLRCEETYMTAAGPSVSSSSTKNARSPLAASSMRAANATPGRSSGVSTPRAYLRAHTPRASGLPGNPP